MPGETRFLIGNGERLSQPVDVAPHGGPKRHPYNLAQTRQRLLPLFDSAADIAEALPDKACPGDHVVAALTLHPSYLAKSYYPEDFLRESGFSAIGSKAREINPKIPPPDRGQKKKETSKDKQKIISQRSYVTTQLFIAGPRNKLRPLSSLLSKTAEDSSLAKDFIKVEDFSIPEPSERVRWFESDSEKVLLEAVLHTGGIRWKMHQTVLDGFKEYLSLFNAKPDFDRKFESDGLLFLPVLAAHADIHDIARFSFVRFLRQMPRLRQFRPFFRDVLGVDTFPVNLPDAPSIDPSIRVACFDGGIPESHGLDKWVNVYESRGIGKPVAEFQQHGLAVTSALLFGPLDDDQDPTRPPMQVDHYRVLDQKTANDSQGELYDVLGRIDDVLKSNPYSYVNLSLGPDLPIEDDDPSAWTTVLDQHFSTGKLLASIAVGNRGDENPATGFTRIQPPSDCVNALSVGSSDSRGENWKRASYSCIGPGRCPGFIKPDVVAFGGSRKEPFWVLDASNTSHARATKGTSFAAPNALRLGVSAQAHFGPVLTPLAIKAILIHQSEDRDHPREEVGWGRVPLALDQLVSCIDGEVHILYQGELDSSRWVRMPIPIPEELAGFVTISATTCYSTRVDPQDSVNYTRSGIEVRFRPHDGKRNKPDQVHPDSKSFFGKSVFGQTEQELRAEAHKWETVLYSSTRMRPSSLSNPSFDIHYMAREEGRQTKKAEKIPYALVVTVRAPKTTSLFDKTLIRYPVLQQLRPVIEIPIRV